MGVINKQKLVIIMVIILVVITISIITQNPISTSPMSFRPILPSRIFEKSTTVDSSYREDYFSIVDLNRSDSTKLFSKILQHACKVVDSVDVKKYNFYRIEYYENGPYMNDSTMKNGPYSYESIYKSDGDLWEVAVEVDAFVCWIIFLDGKLSLIKWYKTGRVTNQVSIPITESLKRKLICK